MKRPRAYVDALAKKPPAAPVAALRETARESEMERDPAGYACDEHLRAAGMGPNRGTCCVNARPLYRKVQRHLESRGDEE